MGIAPGIAHRSSLLEFAEVVWIVDGNGGGEGEEGANGEAAAPRIVSADELGEAAGSTDTPIFRYLSGAAEAGDPKPAYLAIGTYRLPGAFAALGANAKRTGVKLRRAARGFRAWVDPQSPTSVYLARPGEDFQVEVYDPDPKTALEVALSPDLQPVPAG